MANKTICFYYSTGHIYRCIYDESDKVYEVNTLDYKQCKNYRMNERYEACDEDLVKFRDDLIKWNDEIKQFFFKNKDKKVLKIDVFNYNTINEAVYNNVLVNSDQTKIHAIPDIQFSEFVMMQNCKTCGLMTIEKDILEQEVQSYGYDYSKFYYQMMKKIRIPISKPEYYVLDEIDFGNLDFGIYRVKVSCNNKKFWNVFNFNDKHHYTHNTLKVLYKHREKYGITFKLLEPDQCYNYNMVWYEYTIELNRLFKGWFKVMDLLLKKCSSGNWLVKSFVSQAWGNICKYQKYFISDDDCAI
ncbi:MAG: hypothetical protein EOO43_01220 [Flavobacterium sp.]|nr:MAG: hypothetical protein EOO43_01220 [Flavobacterium sp.]